MSEIARRTQKAEQEKSKAYQYKNKKRHFLEIGQKGFLATCNFRERDCVRECYNVLSQYADELYGPEPKGDNKNELKRSEETTNDTDISDDLQKEIDATKAAADPGRSRRFQAVDTGTKNCVFIKTTLNDPIELATKLIKDIAEKKIQKTRYLLRLTPIDAVCKAKVDDIIKAGGAMFDKYFLKEGKTFSIVFNKRFNNDIKRDEIIKILADLVLEKNANNKVDLKNPELSVIVEIIKGKCCLSVVEGYFKYRKYNLVELASRRAEKEEVKDDRINDPKDDAGNGDTKAANGDAVKRKLDDEEEPKPAAEEVNQSKKPEEDPGDSTKEEPTAKKFKEVPEKTDEDHSKTESN